MKEKQKITVYDYTDAIHGGQIPVTEQEDVKKYEVEAWCLQGETGFRAYFYIDDMLCEAHGDDGHWWLIGRMHKHWLAEFKETVNSIEPLT
jgi:hypothetical protein